MRLRGGGGDPCRPRLAGHRYGVRASPVLAELAGERPVDAVDGPPALGTGLSRGGSRVAVSGGLAALELGPAARGLAGARRAAER